jgi:hypothetical protein
MVIVKEDIDFITKLQKSMENGRVYVLFYKKPHSANYRIASIHTELDDARFEAIHVKNNFAVETCIYFVTPQETQEVLDAR